MKFCPQCGSTFEGASGFCPDDGTVLEDAPLKVGQQLDGQYEIEAFIARGGMGTLYRARHILLGDRVVIKILRPEMSSNSEWLRRFQREGQAARRFRHPNAVIVYDLRASADGLTYMVMEYVAGHTLDKELQQRGRFTPLEALQVLEPVARALDVAHAQGVVHRDLKPDNVMLSRDSADHLQVKLLDLGIAKLRGVTDALAGGDEHGLTVAGQILGTPYYMSPEQWGARQRDGNTDVDGRTDIYSLAIIFYELIAGHKPFIASSLPEMQQMHLKEMPLPLREIAPDVPEAFSRAVEQAMAKDRNDRPASIGAFADELRTALELTVEPHAAAAALSSSLITNRPAGQNGQTAATPQTRGEGAETLVRGDVHTVNTGLAPRTHGGATALPVETAQAGRPQPGTSQAAQTYQPAVPPADAEVAPVVPRPKPRSMLPFIVGGVLVLLLAGVGIVGWFAWQSMKGGPENTNVVTNDNKRPGNSNNNNNVPAAPVEALSYWVEAFDSPTQQTGTRVANDGAVSLRSGQQFRFHFMPHERGFLYVLGPGPSNAPMTFLTARPTVGLLKTNLAAAAADFSFPYGAGAVIQLDRNPGTELYTVIFSPTPLLKPDFLAAKAQHELTPDEQAELETLRAHAQAGTPTAGTASADGSPQPAVVVKVPNAPDKAGQPVVFDIRIEHK